ncbi:MAG: LamG domain-containing protein, partial [Patescibacteria group bacterium]
MKNSNSHIWAAVLVVGLFYLVDYISFSSAYDPSLIASWPLNENSGTITADLSGNGRTGALISGPTWVPGKFGSALSFNGLNGYVAINDFNPPTNITLEAWINPLDNSGPTNSIILNKNNTEYDFRIRETGYLAGQVGGVVLEDASLNFYTPANVGQWYHVVYTFDDASNTHKLYRNGVEVASGTNNASIANTGNQLWIGRHSQYNFGTFKGMIDHVKIFDRALTAGEVMGEYTE